MIPRFEGKSQPLIPFHLFVRRILLSLLAAGVILVTALLIGTLGYHHIAGLSWMDALLNASMILTGMGPVDELHTTYAKLFASAYALFSGLVFLTIMGVVLAPLAHRLLHQFHIDDE